MSDFGTLLIARKKDESDLSNSEINNLSSELKEIIKNGEFVNAVGEPFEHNFILDDDKKSAMVQLSEHYYGDEDNDELFQFVEETELEQGEEIIKKLSLEFPEIEFEISVEDW